MNLALNRLDDLLDDPREKRKSKHHAPTVRFDAMARNGSNDEQDGSFVSLPDSEEGQFNDIVENCGETTSSNNTEDSEVEPDDEMELEGRFEDADETELDQTNDAAFETKPVIAMNGSGEVSSLVEDMIKYERQFLADSLVDYDPTKLKIKFKLSSSEENEDDAKDSFDGNDDNEVSENKDKAKDLGTKAEEKENDDKDASMKIEEEKDANKDVSEKVKTDAMEDSDEKPEAKVEPDVKVEPKVKVEPEVKIKS